MIGVQSNHSAQFSSSVKKGVTKVKFWNPFFCFLASVCLLSFKLGQFNPNFFYQYISIFCWRSCDRKFPNSLHEMVLIIPKEHCQGIFPANLTTLTNFYYKYIKDLMSNLVFRPKAYYGITRKQATMNRHFI